MTYFLTERRVLVFVFTERPKLSDRHDSGSGAVSPTSKSIRAVRNHRINWGAYRRRIRRLVERLSGRSERLLKDQWIARVEAHNKTGAELSSLREQLPLILGALDSCAVALADHGHEWTDGERTIYEQAVEILARESSLNAEVSHTKGEKR